jgi:ABC-type antimicrobial peptide transport system permease subunit
MAGLGIGPPLEVVGVARNTRQLRLEDAAAPFVYVPLFQQNADHVRIHVRSAGDTWGVVSAVKQSVRALDPNLPVFDVETLDDHIAEETALLRSFASVATAFGALAVVLATVGLYVVMSFSVAQSTREIGIRMAVGAGRGAVLWLVIRRSMVLVAVGLAAGILGALALTGVLNEALYGLSAADPKTYGGVSLLLSCVGMAAALGPAWRATRVDPLAALREE